MNMLDDMGWVNYQEIFILEVSIIQTLYYGHNLGYSSQMKCKKNNY